MSARFREHVVRSLILGQIASGVDSGLSSSRVNVPANATPEQAYEIAVMTITTSVFSALNELLDLGPDLSSGDAGIEAPGGNNDGTKDGSHIGGGNTAG